MEAVTRKKFDLGGLSGEGIRAILDSLRIDHENVVGVSFDGASGMLEVDASSGGAAEHVEAFVAAMTRTYRAVHRSILKENRVETARVLDIDAELANSGDLLALGDGLVGLSGQLLGLYRFFEGVFRAMALEFAVEEYQYPTMLPMEILAEVGYLEHFPQHITFCSHLRGNLPVLESVASDARAGRGRTAEDVAGRLREPRHALTPAVCLPCYRQLRGARLGAAAVKALTVQNRVFRYEGDSFRPLARAWEFTVRDIVFFGGYRDLGRLRDEVMERALDLCRDLELEASIELAHDPFFLDTSRNKVIYQRMGAVKYELLFPMPDGREALAASSFNLHRDHYTSVYDIRQEGGELSESACMGFGLERWLYGFLTQKGLNPSGWPRRITSGLG